MEISIVLHFGVESDRCGESEDVYSYFPKDIPAEYRSLVEFCIFPKVETPECLNFWLILSYLNCLKKTLGIQETNSTKEEQLGNQVSNNIQQLMKLATSGNGFDNILIPKKFSTYFQIKIEAQKQKLFMKSLCLTCPKFQKII